MPKPNRKHGRTLYTALQVQHGFPNDKKLTAFHSLSPGFVWQITGISSKVPDLIAQMKPTAAPGKPHFSLVDESLGRGVLTPLELDDDEEGYFGFYVRTNLGLILMDERNKPIGFTVAHIDWDSGTTEVEVFVEGVWLKPSRRGKGLSCDMAEALVDLVFQNIHQVDKLLLGSSPIPVDVTYAGDTVTEEGRQFLRVCSEFHKDRLIEDIPKRKRLQDSLVTYDARW